MIGVGDWARYGHLPAIATLPDVDVVAISSRSVGTAATVAAEVGAAHALGDHRDLVAHPDVDLVVVTAPVPEHARLVGDAIEAGKDVYSEWPLTTSTHASQELLSSARAAGVRHVVGLQRGHSPSARFVADLVAQGRVGEIRGATMTVRVDALPTHVTQRHAWSLEPAGFVNLLTVYGGHFADLLFRTVGPPSRVSAIMQNQFPVSTIVETGEQVPSRAPHAVMAMGELQRGGLFSIHLEAAQPRGTGLQLDITGTEGVLRLHNPRAYRSTQDGTVHGILGHATSFASVPVPASYRRLDDSGLDASARDVAYLYDAYAHDVAAGTTTVTDFEDAVRLHRLIDHMGQSSELLLDGPGADILGG